MDSVSYPPRIITQFIAFSPDAQQIASASYDGMIRIWDVTTGQVIAGPFTGHANLVTSVALSPDGQRIASASYDGTTRMWDATSGQSAGYID
jgi:WD40 repeat protein